MTSSPANELHTLVQQAKAGDTAAVERLLIECQPALQRLARRTCPPADAEDAVQEVLLRITGAIGGLRLAGAFLVWSMRMLVRECLRFKRRAARYVLGLPEPTPSQPAALATTLARSAPNTSAAYQEEMVRRDLVIALGALTAGAREILLHRDVLGRTGPETASLLGISLESAKSRLRRARTELRHQYTALAATSRRGCDRS